MTKYTNNKQNRQQTTNSGPPDPQHGQLEPLTGEEREPPGVVQGNPLTAVTKVINSGPSHLLTLWCVGKDKALSGFTKSWRGPHTTQPIRAIAVVAAGLTTDAGLDIDESILSKPLCVYVCVCVCERERERERVCHFNGVALCVSQLNHRYNFSVQTYLHHWPRSLLRCCRWRTTVVRHCCPSAGSAALAGR